MNIRGIVTCSAMGILVSMLATIKAMDTGTTHEQHLKPTQCTSVSWSPDGKYIVAALTIKDDYEKRSREHFAVALFDADTHENIASLFNIDHALISQLPGEKQISVPITSISYNSNAEQPIIAIGSMDGTLSLYDATLKKLLERMQCPDSVSSISWHKRHCMLAAASAPWHEAGNAHVSLLLVVSAKHRGMHDMKTVVHQCYGLGVCRQPSVSMGNATYAVADPTVRGVRVYDFSGKCLKTIEVPHRFLYGAVMHRFADDLIIAGNTLELDSKDMYLLEPTKNTCTNFGDVHTERSRGKIDLKLSLDSRGLRVVLTDPNNGSDGEGSVWVYDVQTQKLLAQFTTPQLHDAALSPDGKKAVVGSCGGWDIIEVDARDRSKNSGKHTVYDVICRWLRKITVSSLRRE